MKMLSAIFWQRGPTGTMVEKRLTTDAMHWEGEGGGGGGGGAHHLGGSAKQRGQGYISIYPIGRYNVYKKLTFSSFLKLSCPRWLNQEQGGTSWQPFGERKIGHKIFVRHVFAIFVIAHNCKFADLIQYNM